MHSAVMRFLLPAQVLPDARSMALSRGDNGGATIVYVGTRLRKEVRLAVTLRWPAVLGRRA